MAYVLDNQSIRSVQPMAKGKSKARKEARRIKQQPAGDLLFAKDSPEEACIECSRFPHASWCLADVPVSRNLVDSTATSEVVTQDLV